ncbi:MAG: cytochrome c oxidase assembly protein, partial [Hyphomicrobiaceae bacterium]
MRATVSDIGLQHRHRRVAAWCGVLAIAMTALAFAAVPLYRLFCQVTGSGGTTQRADRPSTAVLERTVTIRFDANMGPGLSWTFEPLVRTMDVKIGESTLAFYKATNTSNRPLTGTATFNVTPEIAGSYFNKLECFCF